MAIDNIKTVVEGIVSGAIPEEEVKTSLLAGKAKTVADDVRDYADKNSINVLQLMELVAIGKVEKAVGAEHKMDTKAAQRELQKIGLSIQEAIELRAPLLTDLTGKTTQISHN